MLDMVFRCFGIVNGLLCQSVQGQDFYVYEVGKGTHNGTMHCHALPCTAMHCPTKVAFVGFPQSLPRCRMSHGLCSMSKALEKLLSNAMPVDTLKLRCARDAQGAAE